MELNQPQRLNLKKDIRILNEKISAEKKMQNDIGRKFSKDEISKSEHGRLMQDSFQKEALYRNTIVKCENIAHELEELLYQFLDNVKYVTSKLKNVLPSNKREMVDIFCENLEWKDGKARWDWKKPYYFLAKQPKSSTVLPRLDSNQQPST